MPEEREIRVDLPVRAFIPVDYLGQESLRLEMYRRIASSRSEAELDRVREEAEDRFGPVPQEVETLLDLTRLRIAADQAGVEDIGMFRKQVRIRPVELAEDASIPEGSSYHQATKTLNLQPEPSTMGAALPSWVRSSLEGVL
jgi:transcription-repair coupling factor (superfamily II helicase)